MQLRAHGLQKLAKLFKRSARLNKVCKFGILACIRTHSAVFVGRAIRRVLHNNTMDATHVLSEASVQMSQPPAEATFMGLPVELRLQIYGYLLTPCPSPDGVRITYQAYIRPCNLRREETELPMNFCRCALKNIHPQILAISKQVYSEARGIMYDYVACKLWYGGCRGWSHVQPLGGPMRVPLGLSEDALRTQQQATKLVLVIPPGTACSTSFKHSADTGPRNIVNALCDLTTQTFPSLRHMTMHIDLEDFCSDTLWACYGGLMRLPAPTIIDIELQNVGSLQGKRWQKGTRWIKRTLKEALANKAEEMQSSVTISRIVSLVVNRGEQASRALWRWMEESRGTSPPQSKR